MMTRNLRIPLAFAVSLCLGSVTALTVDHDIMTTRRQALGSISGAAALTVLVGNPPPAAHAVAEQPDALNVDDFLRTGTGGIMPMGVSGQAGKSRPETGVVIREGTEVARDARTGDVSAEVLLTAPGSSNTLIPVFASYSSPWPLATGAVFDVECRDLNTGEAAFLAVSKSVDGKSLDALKDSFFVKELTKPSGRFSLYGPPTDVKVKNSVTKRNDKYRQFDLNFSTLSQSTQAEIPRRARVMVTIPDGTDQAVMLVASASASRWNKGGTADTAQAVLDSFQAIPAPTTNLKIRAKARPNA